MTGVIIRRSGDKTAVMEVTTVSRHPLYGKKVVRTKRYLVHDPENKATVGEVVVVKDSHPISARKRWVITSYGPGA